MTIFELMTFAIAGVLEGFLILPLYRWIRRLPRISRLLDRLSFVRNSAAEAAGIVIYVLIWVAAVLGAVAFPTYLLRQLFPEPRLQNPYIRYIILLIVMTVSFLAAGVYYWQEKRKKDKAFDLMVSGIERVYRYEGMETTNKEG